MSYEKYQQGYVSDNFQMSNYKIGRGLHGMQPPRCGVIFELRIHVLCNTSFEMFITQFAPTINKKLLQAHI